MTMIVVKDRVVQAPALPHQYHRILFNNQDSVGQEEVVYNTKGAMAVNHQINGSEVNQSAAEEP